MEPLAGSFSACWAPDRLLPCGALLRSPLGRVHPPGDFLEVLLLRRLPFMASSWRALGRTPLYREFLDELLSRGLPSIQALCGLLDDPLIASSSTSSSCGALFAEVLLGELLFTAGSWTSSTCAGCSSRSPWRAPSLHGELSDFLPRAELFFAVILDEPLFIASS